MKIIAPIKGSIVPIEDVSDETFAKKEIGDGIAIKSNKKLQIVRSPMEGTLQSIFPTNHAFVVKNNEKQVLIHIGIETVEMEGKCFLRMAKEGQKLKAGDAVVLTDFRKIEKAGLDSVVLILSPENDVFQKTKEKEADGEKTVLFEI